MLKKIVQENKEVEYIENEEISEEGNNKRKYLSFLNESEKNVTDFISSCDEFKKNKDNVILSSIKSVLKFRKKGYTIVFMVFALMFFLMSLTINVAIKKMSENSISNILYNNNIDVYSFQHSLGGAMFFTILLGGGMFIIWMCQKYCLYEEINEDYSIKLKNILNSLRYNELYFFIKEKELSDAEAMKFITFMRKNKETKWSKFFDKFNIFNINKVREDNSLHDKLEKKYLKFLNLNGQQSELKIDKGENNEIVEKTNN